MHGLAEGMGREVLGADALAFASFSPEPFSSPFFKLDVFEDRISPFTKATSDPPGHQVALPQPLP